MVYVLQTQAALPTAIPPLAETFTAVPVTMPPTWTPPIIIDPATRVMPPTWTPPAALTENNLSSHLCRINGPFPDLTCTPGAVFNVTAAQVCISGYSSSVRDVSESLKNQVYAAYGIINRSPGQYEVDHFIPLELGGSNDITNLFPEAASPKPGFHEKDKVENYLHDQVCNGSIDLQLAQAMIREDWVKVYDALNSAAVSTPQIINSQPMSTPVPTPQIIESQPTSTSAPPSQTCCKICGAGKACGDSCISKDKTCSKPPGCACQGP